MCQGVRRKWIVKIVIFGNSVESAFFVQDDQDPMSEAIVLEVFDYAVLRSRAQQ